MICPKCGTENSNGVKFCTFCGNALAVPETVVPEQTIVQEPVQTWNQMPQENQVPPMQQMPTGQIPPMQQMPTGQVPPMQQMPTGQVPPQQYMPQGGQVPPQQYMPQGGQVPPQQYMQGGQIPPQQYMPQGGQVPPQQYMQGGQIPPQRMSYIPPAQPEKKKSGAGKIVVAVIILLLIACVGLTAVITVDKVTKQQKLQKLLTSAEDYLDGGEYEKAVDAFKEVLDMEPEKDAAISGITEAYIGWAASCAEDGNYEEALSILQDADDRARQKNIKQTIAAIEDSMRVVLEFSDNDLIFTSESGEQVTAELNHAFIAWYEEAYLTDYADGYWDEWTENFSTARGLELGMTIDDFIELYSIEKDYAIWEVYSGDENEYTSFEAYTGQDPADLYEEYNNVWLDIGFCKENGEWQQLEDYEIQDTWFCDADLDDYDEVVVLAVNIDDYGYVAGISLEHFTYDEDWVEWQGWVE